ncbi:Putative phosphoenolpyruvate synthase [Araneus ventricosus]|uniref:Phosphoenolpyruvate synthase n=1 Tax=Araneus ventricosus TaxID=182803 RepID=A0A4Y2FZK5_ARAVE|nr:Putative phosphoenolpyruvate synthase [Araneus ventricosus]
MLVTFLVGLFTAPFELVYWVKWAIAYLAIRIYNAIHRKKRFDLYDISAKGDAVKLGYITPVLEKELESPFPESHLQEACDEVIIYGTNSKSECLFVRISRGCDQVADAWIYLKLANGKTYSLAETSGYQLPFDGKCQAFSSGKLQMHYLIPMRKWRIFFCGMLQQNCGDKEVAELVFVKFAFLWKAASHVYDCTFDTNPKEFANAIAKSEWEVPFLPPIKRVADSLNFYAESGIVAGTVSVDGASDYEMYLSGEKIRNIGKNADLVGFKFTNLLGYTHVDGFSFHLASLSLPHAFKNLSIGYTVDGDADLRTLEELDMTVEPFSGETFPSAFKAKFKAGAQYEVVGRIAQSIVFNSEQGWEGSLKLSFVKYKLGGKNGNGLLLTGEVLKGTQRPIQCKRSIPFPENVPLTVKFTDEISQLGNISGGKGSSLGKLTQLSKKEKTFIVPKGIVVTTSAYCKFLTRDVLDAVKYLEDVAYGNQDGDLKEACNRVASIVENSLLPVVICRSITEDLKELFGGDVNERKFAVRSSATGEDTASMSAAGQMDTFLGVQGINEIFAAVKKCWASQFGHIAVEYKKRYGQVLNSPMAVVIQEMVACEVSGVMFTCDPVTNNPSIITITANYGLGETVVSGSVEPDTFVLRRKDDQKVELESVTVGSKEQRIIMQGSIRESLEETTPTGLKVKFDETANDNTMSEAPFNRAQSLMTTRSEKIIALGATYFRYATAFKKRNQ